jgi:hypothetical protein
MSGSHLGHADARGENAARQTANVVVAFMIFCSVKARESLKPMGFGTARKAIMDSSAEREMQRVERAFVVVGTLSRTESGIWVGP